MNKNRHTNNNKGRNNKGNNKGGYDKNKDLDSNCKSEETKDAKDTRPKMNLARWYMPSDFIMEQHNYAMEGVLGIPFDMSDYSPAAENMPTICAIKFQHTPGDTSRDILNFANPKSAPINVAAKYFYTVLSSRNKKTTNYQPQDVALAIFAESELISMFALGARLYGVMLMMNTKNRIVPRQLITAMGFDVDDVMANRTKFRDFYNILAQAANALPFVDNIKEFEKAWALFADYYADEASDMCQYYVPTFDTIGVYNESVDPGDPTKLIKTIDYEALGTYGSITIVQYFNKLKKMIDNLQTSSLMNYVYSDLLNYMSDEGAAKYNFSLLPDMYIIAPVYNELVLTQIHNLEIKGVPTIGSITQDPTQNIIETHISWVNANCPAWDIASQVDFPYTNNPSVEEKIDSVMFKATGWHSIQNADNTYSPSYQTAIDYIPTQIKFFDCTGIVGALNRTHYQITDFVSTEFAVFSKFRAAPLIYLYDGTDFVRTVGEANTLTRLKYSDIKVLFDQGVLGLYTFDAERAFSPQVIKE